MQHCMRLNVILKIWNVVLQVRVTFSSVGRGGGGGKASPLACQPKCRIKKNNRFLALLRLVFALESTKKRFKASFEK